MSPATASALPSQKLTQDPHGDVTQNENEEEHTADDICAAPGRENEEDTWRGGVVVGSMVWRSHALESWGMLESRRG